MPGMTQSPQIQKPGPLTRSCQRAGEHHRLYSWRSHTLIRSWEVVCLCFEQDSKFAPDLSREWRFSNHLVPTQRNWGDQQRERRISRLARLSETLTAFAWWMFQSETHVNILKAVQAPDMRNWAEVGMNESKMSRSSLSRDYKSDDEVTSNSQFSVLR